MKFPLTISEVLNVLMCVALCLINAVAEEVEYWQAR